MHELKTNLAEEALKIKSKTKALNLEFEIHEEDFGKTEAQIKVDQLEKALLTAT